MPTERGTRMHKRTCAHCLASRDAVRMLQENGAWYCRSVVECLESYANLPGWLRV